MTESTPVHGCTIDGQPAMPILISEYNQLIARASETEARLAHLQATSEAAGRLLTRTTDERDQLRGAVARVRDFAADIERSGWTGPAIARRIHEALDEPDPAATQATDGICSDPASGRDARLVELRNAINTKKEN